jgi:hypothetical protein
MHIWVRVHAFTDPVGELFRDVDVSLECLLNKIAVTTHTKTEELLITSYKNFYWECSEKLLIHCSFQSQIT